jgi:ABC-type uncharacterized transport system ATPase subunit
VRMRTKLKNKIHSIMNGTSVSYVGTHIFTKGYIEKLKELNDYRINGYLRIIESLNDEIDTVSKKILLLAQEDEIARLLMTVPGIGYYSALLIVSGMDNTLLILDEPTDGFGKEQLFRLRQVLNELNSAQIIMVSHERELESLADKIYRVTKDGSQSRFEVVRYN